MSMNIPLSSPVFEGNENRYAGEAIHSGNLATFGSFIPRFEEKLASMIGSKEVVALNSGTAAIHLGLNILGVGVGDEVICQSFTFCASANPIVYLGAIPIFVDSEIHTWNICPDLLEDAILSRIAKGKKPKAIVLVHLFGMPARMQEILQIALKYEIPVLEDAAEAMGSRYHGEPCGTLGQIGIFSFNGNKIMTTGGGGVLISSHADYIKKARLLALQAKEDLPYYQHFEIGFNYKMNNLAAAIGLAQLECFDIFLTKRREINAYYKTLFAQIPGIKFQAEAANSFSNYWLSAVLIDESQTGFSSQKIRDSLLKETIETRFLWKPLHLQPIFEEAPYYGGTNAELMFKQGLCLPSSANLTRQAQERVFEVIQGELVNHI